MKKALVAILITALLLSFAGCKPSSDGNGNVDPLANGKVHTDFPGVETRIAQVYTEDGKTKLAVIWSNNTDYEVMYGETYAIQRLDGTEWVSCSKDELTAFITVGYALKAGKEISKTYTISDLFDVSQPGTYRFKSSCSVYADGNKSQDCALWAEFTLGNVKCPDDSKEAMTEVEWAAQYIRTDGYHENVKYPVVKIIRSVRELNAYYEANKELYNLERREDPASDYTIGFLDACDKYDDAYFEDQILIMVLLEEGSGSVRHNVDNVKTGSDGKLYVSIRTIVPEVGTADMAEWHILIEPEADINIASESDVIVYLDGFNPKTQPAVVRETGSFSNITLTIPHDWNYEIERGNNADEYCIAFWPENQTEGKIKMWYYTAFGVCGTGLEEEEITVGEYKARKGTYDNKKVWDFISFADMPGSYVAMNEGADKWWSGYGDEAMQILSTVKIAEGILTEQQAIDLAKKVVTVEYNQTTARFDTENGLWTVIFSKKKTAGGDQVFTITHEGKIIDVEYGK